MPKVLKNAMDVYINYKKRKNETHKKTVKDIQYYVPIYALTRASQMTMREMINRYERQHKQFYVRKKYGHVYHTWVTNITMNKLMDYRISKGIRNSPKIASAFKEILSKLEIAKTRWDKGKGVWESGSKIRKEQPRDNSSSN